METSTGVLRERFSVLAEDCKSQSLDLSSLINSDYVDKIHSGGENECNQPNGQRGFYLILIAALVAICITAASITSLLVVWWPSELSRLLSACGITSTEPCVMDAPEPLFDWTRPPADCSVCRGVEHIDRVSNLNTRVFEMKYAYSGVPVVVTDGTKDWTAHQVFNISFFKELYAEDSPVLSDGDHGNCQFFPWKGDYESLSHFFETSGINDTAHADAQIEPWYIGWSNCDSTVANVLRQYYQKPYFLPAVAESGKTDWIFMGSPGHGAPLHIDNVGNPSWQAQIVGQKRWTFEPQPECYFYCKNQLTVDVHPGEVIVLDSNKWFHATEIIGDDVSIVIGSEYD